MMTGYKKGQGAREGNIKSTFFFFWLAFVFTLIRTWSWPKYSLTDLLYSPEAPAWPHPFI